MHCSGSALLSIQCFIGNHKALEGTMQFPNMAHSLHNTVSSTIQMQSDRSVVGNVKCTTTESS